MQFVIKCLLVFYFSWAHSVQASQPEIGDLVGKWQVFDGPNNTKSLQLEITYDAHTNAYVGHIIRLQPNAPFRANDLCVKCPRPQRGKQMLGLNILWGLKPKVKENGSFTGNYHLGHFLNPLSGEVADVSLAVSRSNKIIKVLKKYKHKRLGNTHTWLRLK